MKEMVQQLLSALQKSLEGDNPQQHACLFIDCVSVPPPPRGRVLPYLLLEQANHACVEVYTPGADFFLLLSCKELTD